MGQKIFTLGIVPWSCCPPSRNSICCPRLIAICIDWTRLNTLFLALTLGIKGMHRGLLELFGYSVAHTTFVLEIKFHVEFKYAPNLDAHPSCRFSKTMWSNPIVPMANLKNKWENTRLMDAYYVVGVISIRIPTFGVIINITF